MTSATTPRNAIAQMLAEVDPRGDLARGMAEIEQLVAKALSERVKAAAVCDLFLSKEPTIGYERTLERLGEGATHAWYHFHAAIPAALQSRAVDEACGQARTTVQVAGLVLPGALIEVETVAARSH